MTDGTDSANEASLTALQKLTHLWWRAEAAIEKFQQSLKMNTPEPGTTVAREAPHTDNSVRGAGRGNVNINRIEVGERTWAIIAIMLASLAIGLAILAVVLSQQSEREARLAQYDLQILRAKVEAAGIKTDDH